VVYHKDLLFDFCYFTILPSSVVVGQRFQ